MPLYSAESHFSELPTADIKRSRMDKSKRLLTSFDVGDVVPIYLEEVLPGDTFSLDTAKVVRMQPLATALMDNIYLDTYYFFVPARLCWKHWRELMGENTSSAWIPTVEYQIPQVTAPEGGWSVGTLGDYFGIPTGVSGLSVNALPFRAYALIINEWFRDENLQDPLLIPDGDETYVGSNGSDYIQDIAKGGKPFVAAKFHDYFTSALPSPQKGPDVTLPVKTDPWPVLPFRYQEHDIDYTDVSKYGLGWTSVVSTDANVPQWRVEDTFYRTTFGSNSSALTPSTTFPDHGDVYTTVKSVIPNNLYAIPSAGVFATINELRLAFQIQRLYERDARGGTRYIELLRSHFGVTSPDSRLQRPEYLGGNRIPLNITQVVQQSGTVSDSTPQGTITGTSLSTDRHSDFTQSFTEHGYLIGVCVARYDHTYQQGLERLWTRRDRFDFYWPALAHIGEQPIRNDEIFAQGTSADSEVFGYNEAWAEYRYGVSRVSGEMRSQYAQSLDAWHLADYYAELPRLSAGWIKEEKSVVDRALAVSSRVSNQIFGDFFFKCYATRPMPLFSVPGLIDHF